MLSSFGPLLLFISTAYAAPNSVSSRQNLDLRRTQPFIESTSASWDAGSISQYPIHASCNATQRRQIEAGLNETILLAQHAQEHVLRWGHESEIYRKYFGNRPTYEVIGGFSIISSGDKGGVLFRCDNPDGNCAQDGWAGHWRGDNGTDETVICDLSYTSRRYLVSMCGQGFSVSSSPINTFWASDLMHRLYHMPAVGGSYIEHFADGHQEVLALAQRNGTEATHDSESLQYFALEAYAYDIAIPGIGCPGSRTTVEAVQRSGAAAPSTDTTMLSATSTGTPTLTQSPSATSVLPDNCHTHEGGFVHCTK